MKLYFLKKVFFVLGAGILFFSFIVASPVFANKKFKLDDEILVKAEKEYGFAARVRLRHWEELVRNDESYTDMEKLEKVNAFFNHLEFVSDADHWGKEDYWATPVEFIASGGGDCEEFSVAKYFTLRALGVSDSKLSLTYVKALSLDTAHMVVTYYERPEADPLVLDNLVDEIQPASKRTDLLPVYNFNGTGLWIAKRKGKGQLIGKSDALDYWKELLERMPEGLF